MFRNMIAPALLSAVFATSALADDGWKVKDVDVNVDLTAITNAEAAGFWSDIEGDLQNAIVARVVDRTADEGVTIRVDVTELELANSFDTAIADASSRLSGEIEIRERGAGARASRDDQTPIYRTFALDVTVDAARLVFPEEEDLSVPIGDSDTYYQALVDAFAGAIVERLD